MHGIVRKYGEDKFFDRGGWIGCHYDKADFRMTPRRMEDLEGMIECVREDLPRDLMDVKDFCNLIKNGHVDAAVRLYQRLDTIVRDQFPQWVWELSGSSVNPRSWKYENSLHGTE